jgi:tetratricopeptide (TPR) repeat protein
MTVSAAERSFNKGLAALAAAQPLRAVDCFLEAMQIEERLQLRDPDMRYLSYYGLSLARANRATHLAFEACDLAARHDPSNPLLLLNLGRVLLLAGRRALALACFERGLRIAPDHLALKRELGRVDRRSPPPLRFLDRSHTLNRYIGRLRESLRMRLLPRFRSETARSP